MALNCMRLNYMIQKSAMGNPFQFGRELVDHKEGDQGKVRMRYEDPFFARWIARFTAPL